MRISFAAVVASAALATGALAAPAGTAQAESPIDWGMTLSVYDTSWSQLLNTNFLGCADLPIRVSGWVASEQTPWEISGVITGSDSTVVLETFTYSGTGSTPGFDGVAIPGVTMCRHFEGPVAPPNHEYVVTATARVPSSLTPEQPLTDRFVIAPIQSMAFLNVHEERAGVSTLIGSARVTSLDGFSRAAPVALVTAERLEGATWLTVGSALPAADGSVTISADRLLPAGTYIRTLYAGTYWAASHVGMPWQLTTAWKPPPTTPPPPPGMVVSPPPPVTVVLPTPTVKVKAVSGRSKLKVDVNPNMGSQYWTFQVHTRLPDGTWKALKTYRTLGATEKRTVNLPKGTYKVWVNPKFTYQGAMSAGVTLKR